MSDLGPPTALIATLVRLRQTLVDHNLPFEAGDVDAARHERASLIKQLDDYVIPRLVQIEAPLLAVVGGSTGAGKSTLVNTLVGSRVSEPGVLRPTTRSPVLVHNPDDAHWFGTDRLLPDLVAHRPRHPRPGHAAARARASTCRTGLAILDAPDVDSVEERNRTLAGAAAGGRRPVAVRDVGGAIRRPGALGLPQGGGRAEHRRGSRPRPHHAGGGA